MPTGIMSASSKASGGTARQTGVCTIRCSIEAVRICSDAQFHVNDVDLTEFRLVRILRDASEVRDNSTSMRGAFDAEPFDQAHFPVWFAC
jgi:hypothetical protein